MDRVSALDAVTVSTDFSEKNPLRPVAPASSRNDVLDALRTLRIVGAAFYNPDVLELIDAATQFVSRYKGMPETDAFGWKIMAYWVTSKFYRYRSLVVAHDLDSAATVYSEFSRNNEDLLELQDLRMNQGPPSTQGHRTRNNPESGRRTERTRQQTNSIPPAVLDALPRQGGQRLCMKFLSNVGCTGDGRGGFFDRKRTHFRPTQLPEVVRELIEERFRGIAPVKEEQ